jgi:hypothetical protein
VRVNLTEEDSGTRRTVRVGEELTVVLAENPRPATAGTPISTRPASSKPTTATTGQANHGVRPVHVA